MTDKILKLDELHDLIVAILIAHGSAEQQANTVARFLVAAEADGQRGHGASRVPSYAGQVKSGRVDGHASPEKIQLSATAAIVDAHNGFAFPALELAQQTLKDNLAHGPVALVVIRNSHHSGVVGHHVEPLARDGFIAMSMGNGPKAIAPWGGNRGLFGTNPIAFAAPRQDDPPLVIDMSLSKVARGWINVAAQADEPIPPDWAFDADGNPTTDAKEAMAGTLAPMGDAKGAQLILMVEILAGALSAGYFGFESTSLFDSHGKPPRAGQFMLAIDPNPFSEGLFGSRLEDLIAQIEAQPETRIPGQRRYALREIAMCDGISVPAALYEELLTLRG